MSAVVACVVHDWGTVAKAVTLGLSLVGAGFVAVMMHDDWTKTRRR